MAALIAVLIGGLLVTAARFNRLSDDMNRGFAQVSRRFAQIEARFAQMDERFAQIDGILLDRADRPAGLDAVRNAHNAPLRCALASCPLWRSRLVPASHSAPRVDG